jgi:hypothetical protein
MVGGESPAQAQFHPELDSFVAAAAEEHPVMIPNAPSSPLWSLADQTEHRPSLPERAAQAIQEETRTTVIEAAEIGSRTQMEDARAPEERSEEVDTTPHEARKGWWQRRFKI